MSFEAATAKSTIGELRSQVQESSSAELRAQAALQHMRTESTANLSKIYELTSKIAGLERQLISHQSLRHDCDAAKAACASAQAERDERDKLLRELVDENDGLQARLQELQEAAARQEAVASAQLQVERAAVARLSADNAAAQQATNEESLQAVLDLKSQIEHLKSHIEHTAAAETLLKLRVQQELVHAQKEIIELTSRLAVDSQKVADLQLANSKIDSSYQEMRKALSDVVDENDRLTRSLNAQFPPGTSQTEQIVQTHALKVQHELLLSALHRFWDAVGVLPSLSNLSLDEHGVIFEAVVAMQSYLGAVNLLSVQAAPQPQSLLMRKSSSAKHDDSHDRSDFGISTPSNKNRAKFVGEGSSASTTSEISPQRRSLFRSIIQRRA
jgi:chromosome segregation ATPase